MRQLYHGRALQRADLSTRSFELLVASQYASAVPCTQYGAGILFCTFSSRISNRCCWLWARTICESDLTPRHR